MMDEQIAYYRRRAAEYDTTAYRDGDLTGDRLAAIVDRFGPTGDLLEIACGTGVWTRHLVRHASRLTALDAAPEMLDAARDRVPSGTAEFVTADVFHYPAAQAYDTVFFAFWLSHVPDWAFDEFWARVRGWLRVGGRAIFVDERPAGAVKESYVDGEPDVVERRLGDGSTYRIVKVFRGTRQLERRLADLGWQATVSPLDAEWLLGEARPVGMVGR